MPRPDRAVTRLDVPPICRGEAVRRRAHGHDVPKLGEQTFFELGGGHDVSSGWATVGESSPTIWRRNAERARCRRHACGDGGQAEHAGSLGHREVIQPSNSSTARWPLGSCATASKGAPACAAASMRRCMRSTSCSLSRRRPSNPPDYELLDRLNVRSVEHLQGARVVRDLRQVVRVHIHSWSDAASALHRFGTERSHADRGESHDRRA
jgi:hypothetical protein